ncbi:MAG: response regulator, partial [Verrucomicrobia bacterium]|nr:response regulator [Verrucomicrobiota bacterium]
DMNMPVMNGRDTLIAMREMNPEVKAILATGYSLDANAQEILDEGALSYIQKPYRVDDLVQQIEQALNTIGA